LQKQLEVKLLLQSQYMMFKLACYTTGFETRNPDLKGFESSGISSTKQPEHESSYGRT